MQQIIATNEAKSQVLHDFIQKTYVPQLADHLSRTDSYLGQEGQDFRQLVDSIDRLQQVVFEKKQILSKTVKQLNDKLQSEQEKFKKAETYKKGKKEELTAIQKAIDSISSAMKETCSKIDSEALKKISQLPQGMDAFMAKLFNIIYNEEEKKFDWVVFKKKVFEDDKGSDFQGRLANFQFKGVSQEKENFLLQMKQDPQFQKVYQDPLYTKAFLDIADWIHFVVSGIDNQRKKDGVQIEFDKVDKDFTVRGKEMKSMEKTLNFWQSSLQYAEDQLVYLNQLSPNMLQVEQDVNQSKKTLDGHIDQFISQAQQVNGVMKADF